MEVRLQLEGRFEKSTILELTIEERQLWIVRLSKSIVHHPLVRG